MLTPRSAHTLIAHPPPASMSASSLASPSRKLKVESVDGASASASASASTAAAAASPVVPVASEADVAALTLQAERLRKAGLKRLLQSKQSIHERSESGVHMKRGRVPECLPAGQSRDVIQKGGAAGGKAAGGKRRFLCQLPFRFSCRTSGRQLGWLVHLNTRNPVMYIQFPLGRLKLFGTLLPNLNSYMVLQCPTGKRATTDPLQVKGTFDRTIAFNEWRWVGKQSDNPDDHELPLPPEIKVEPRRVPQLGMGGSMPHSSGSGSQPEGEGTAASDALDDDRGIIDLADDDDAAAPSSSPLTPAKRKRASSSFARMGATSSDDERDSDEEEEADDDDDDDGEVTSTPVRKRRQSASAPSSGAGSSKKRGGKRRRDTSSDEEEEEGEEGEDDAEDDDDAADEGADAAVDSDDDAPPRSQESARPRRAAANTKSYKDSIIVDDSEDEPSSEEEQDDEDSEEE